MATILMELTTSATSVILSASPVLILLQTAISASLQAKMPPSCSFPSVFFNAQTVSTLTIPSMPAIIATLPALFVLVLRLLVLNASLLDQSNTISPSISACRTVQQATSKTQTASYVPCVMTGAPTA